MSEQNQVCVAKDQQLGSLTGQSNTSTKNDGPAVPIEPNVSAKTSHPVPANSVTSFSITPNVSSTTGSYVAPVLAPYAVQTNNAPTLPLGYTVPPAIGYQTAPPRATVVPQQNVFFYLYSSLKWHQHTQGH